MMKVDKKPILTRCLDQLVEFGASEFVVKWCQRSRNHDRCRGGLI